MPDSAADLPLSSPQDVGLRLEAVRKRLKFSQTDFAIKAQIGRERLASYESGRVALPWNVGLQICSTHNLNAGWIAEGRGPWQPFWKPGDIITGAERRSFVEVYRELESRFAAEAILSIAGVANSSLELSRTISENPNPWAQSTALVVALESIQTLFDILPQKDRKNFAADLEKFAGRYIARAFASVPNQKNVIRRAEKYVQDTYPSPRS